MVVAVHDPAGGDLGFVAVDDFRLEILEEHQDESSCPRLPPHTTVSPPSTTTSTTTCQCVTQVGKHNVTAGHLCSTFSDFTS
jgi:hypothetical protein